MSNPYQPVLFQLAERNLRLKAADILAAPNVLKVVGYMTDGLKGMCFAEVADHAVVGAYAFHDPASPMRGEARLRDWVIGRLRELYTGAPNGYWSSAQPGGNSDFFTLLPMMESFMLIREAVRPEDRDHLVARFTTTLGLMHEHFGRKRTGRHLDAYPNIEVNYCLCLYYGYVLTGDPLFKAEFERFLERLARAQFADGGWTYIWDTAECPHYHGHLVSVMSRIASVSGHPSAMAQLLKSIPFYPRAVARNGVIEHWSDCWWKHVWNTRGSPGPDTVASMTGDGRNRWLGDRCRSDNLDELTSGYGISNCNALFALYSSLAWKEVAPVPPPEVELLYDGNIRGPRGLFPEWSWGACSRYCNDTVVGAVAHAVKPISALAGVIAQIPYWREGETPETDNSQSRRHLSVLPKGTVAHTAIEDGQARFRVAYQMANACCAWQVEEHFPYPWICRQDWTLDRRAMCGRVEMQSIEDQLSRPPMLRIRFVRDGVLEERGNDTFFHNPFVLRLPRSDLPHRRVVDACSTLACPRGKAVELQLFADENLAERPFRAGESYSVALEIAIL